MKKGRWEIFGISPFKNCSSKKAVNYKTVSHSASFYAWKPFTVRIANRFTKYLIICID